jgi:hypothetical protein
MLSEGGIGWVPSLLDRLDHIKKHHGYLEMWRDQPLSPSEVLQRNFWFCALDDMSGFELRHRIGIDKITVEVDYPHSDSSWPDTQELLHRQIGHLPPDEIRKFTWENAARLFRHPMPDDLDA